jgi:hypothetical protein
VSAEELILKAAATLPHGTQYLMIVLTSDGNCDMMANFQSEAVPHLLRHSLQMVESKPTGDSSIISGAI